MWSFVCDLGSTQRRHVREYRSARLGESYKGVMLDPWPRWLCGLSTCHSYTRMRNDSVTLRSTFKVMRDFARSRPPFWICHSVRENAFEINDRQTDFDQISSDFVDNAVSADGTAPFGLWNHDWKHTSILHALILIPITHQVTTLHMPRQLSCHGICKLRPDLILFA